MIILVLSPICIDVTKENVLIYSINTNDDNFFLYFQCNISNNADA